MATTQAFQYGHVLSGDVAPTFAMQKLKETHQRYFNKTFHIFNGRVAQDDRGRMFADTHMHQKLMHWRATAKHRMWCFDLGDPTQVEKELIL
jgi:hypothetical protein